MTDVKLSAVILSQNEEHNLPRCLSSLEFADEIVVVDALSEDDSVKIAGRYGARVFSKPWEGFAPQWQYAIDQALGEWVLLCAADEEVPSSLAREIRHTIEANPRCQGYRLSRQSQFLGEWMGHGPWAKDSQLRLFKRGSGRISPRSVHEGVRIEGEVGGLHEPLYHFTHQTISESIARLNRYTSLEAKDRQHRRRIGIFDFVFPPFGVFFKYYVSRGCWRAGIRGFLLSAITAIYKSVLYMKIYYIQRFQQLSE